MRLDARAGDMGWFVFDVKRLRAVPEAVWVDDQSARWGAYAFPSLSISLVELQEERIRIYPEKRLVMFNEVDDENDAHSSITSTVPETPHVA